MTMSAKLPSVKLVRECQWRIHGISARKLPLASVIGIILLCGVVVWGSVPDPVMKSLQAADHYELLSLDPGHFSTPQPNSFHQFNVLGRTFITDPATRAKLNSALQVGAREPGVPARCFNPRHGIRVTHAGHTTDLVICFECRQVKVYEDDQPVPGFLVSASPQVAFDAVLKASGVPLAKTSY